MKRTRTLVSYESPDEDGEGTLSCTDAKPTRKRKLPRISPSLTIPAQKSDPALHQGRIRTTPHVDGQFAALVYLPVLLEGNAKLHELLEEAVRRAKDVEPALNSDWLDSECRNRELHISLTRSIYLHHHQREELKRAVKAAARSHDPFAASFSTFATFDNDERTRTFLGIEVGAGHSELKSLSKSLEHALRLLHQKEFYSEPRFHASIAWALLSTGASMSGAASLASQASSTQTHAEYLAIPSFPSSMLSGLNAQFGRVLSSSKVGAFEVENICVKIGREVFCWDLGRDT